jgi:hypothetical protein
LHLNTVFLKDFNPSAPPAFTLELAHIGSKPVLNRLTSTFQNSSLWTSFFVPIFSNPVSGWASLGDPWLSRGSARGCPLKGNKECPTRFQTLGFSFDSNVFVSNTTTLKVFLEAFK